MAAKHHHAVQRTITGIKISAKETENATIAHFISGKDRHFLSMGL